FILYSSEIMKLTELAKKISFNLRKIKDKSLKPPSCFIGFDGFTDEIINVVDKIIDKNSKTYIKTIKDFGSKILKSSKKSCNLNLFAPKGNWVAMHPY